LVPGAGPDVAGDDVWTRFWLVDRAFEFPVAVARSGRAALSRCRVFIGNFVLDPRMLHSLDRQTEHTNPISTIFLWQKHAARKSTCSCVGTESVLRIDGGGRKDIIRYCSNASRLSRKMYDPPVRCAACCRNTVLGP